MVADRPICILLGALGGQGGGVLADWLVEAAHHSGYPAQATSTPGVAQRTGATTYYFELFPEKNPPGEPIFTLFPGTGDLDIIAALEPTEAGRSLERGYITETTTVITGTERVYSTAEKMAAGDGTINDKPMMESLEKASKKLVRLDIDSLAGDTASRINSVMFGSIIGSGILPLDDEDGRHAIRNKGVSVSSNLEGYDIGLETVRAGGSASQPDAERPYKPVPASFEKTISAYPEQLRDLLGHGFAKLLDYQDEAYASLYLERVNTVVDIDTHPSRKLTKEIIKRLAIWMSFEDIIRVAQLKTRPGRLDRIRQELGVDVHTPLKLTDYFKPGRDEFIGILPPSLSWVVPKWNRLDRGKGLALHMPTGTIFGFTLLKFMASLRFLRRSSSQYREEQNHILNWLGAVKIAEESDYDLACRTAQLSIWARGYGNVRQNGQSILNNIFKDWQRKLATDMTKVSIEVDQSLLLAHSNPDAPEVIH